MSMIINDEIVEARLIEERRAKGLDGFDEVWDGVYVMSPLANNEHQRIAGELTAALHGIVSAKGLGAVYPGANVSDRNDDWTQNYRVPDILVFLNETKAEDRDTHWFGGPEFAVEVVSEGDGTLKKLEFYASVNTQELLIIDRHPWQLTLYRRGGDGEMRIAATCAVGDVLVIESNVLPARFSLRKNESCIRVEDVKSSRCVDIHVSLSR